MSNRDCDVELPFVGYGRLVKRSLALRGRNQTRDIQASDAPMVCQALIRFVWSGPFFLSIGHRSHASKIHSAHFLVLPEVVFQHALAG